MVRPIIGTLRDPRVASSQCRPGPATPFDAPVLAAISASACPDGEQWSEAAFAAQLAFPGVFGFIAEAGGAILARVAADEAEILTLAVEPDARRIGLGRALLDAAQQEAARRGAAAMFLEVAAGNAPARALYAAAHYAEIGRRRRYYPNGCDALVLRRALQPPVETS